MSDLASITSLALKARKDFPVISTGVAYLDNASTALKPRSVIDAITKYYTEYSANVHRGIYDMSERASTEYERTRGLVQKFVNAEHEEEIIFTYGTTHGMNLVAQLIAQQAKEGDEIILTQIEHHANLIPWQLMAKRTGVVLRFLNEDENGELSVQELEELITDRTIALSLSHMSNVTGYQPPLQEMAAAAHAHDILVIVDAAQSVAHMPVDVQDLDVDFLLFSGHKMCGPTGTGALYGRRELLEKMEPVFGGGSMIDEVTLLESTWAPLPAKFEPGTPNIAGIIGLGAAVEYLEEVGMKNVQELTEALSVYAHEQFAEHLSDVTTYGPKDHSKRHGMISFAADGVHAHDMASTLDAVGVAVRAGHHCAQPMMKNWGVTSTTRASFQFYNTTEEIDLLVEGVRKAIDTFRI